MNEVALVVVHARVEWPPIWIAVGLATSVHVGAGGGGGVVVTVTVALQFTVWPSVAVAVPV